MVEQMADFHQRWQCTDIDPLVNPPINILVVQPDILLPIAPTPILPVPVSPPPAKIIFSPPAEQPYVC